MSKSQTSAKFTLRKLVFTAVLIALGFVLSYIKLFRMPMGGSVTAFSMLFVALIGYFFGPLYGFSGAFAYSILQFVQNPEFLSIWQVLFDYVLAFTALGLSFIMRKKKYGLVVGYLCAIIGRIIFASIASLLFWSEWLPTLPDAINYPAIAALAYNGAYIGTEGIITLVIIAIPPVNAAIRKMKQFANKQS